MSFEINDISSSILQRNLATSSKDIKISFAKLAHGKQSSAVENAASLVISEQMEAQKRGSQEALENALTGMNMLQTADSGLNSINENLQRIRELKIQSENGTLSDRDKEAINQEISSLTSEIDRIAKTTSFNKINLLDGSSMDLEIQVGANSDPETNSKQVGNPLDSATTESLGLDPNSPDFLKQLDNAIKEVLSRRSEIGALNNGLESTINSLYVRQENLNASQSRIQDTDIALEISKLTQNQILQNASVSLMSQANQTPAIIKLLVG